MTARRLRAHRPVPHAALRPGYRGGPFTPEEVAGGRTPKLVLAPGHSDGDGCTFPAPDHLIPEETIR